MDKTEQVAAANTQEWLIASPVPKEEWDGLLQWVEDTGIGEVYLEGHERIGAWWAAREVAKMGFEINFTKAGILPSEWYPDGDNWKVAQAEAKLRLVASWQDLLDRGALTALSQEEIGKQEDCPVEENSEV